MHSVGGRLLFYRWPERHACLADAPGDVHEVAQRCSRAVVFFKIPHGYGRGSNDPDGPEDGTACAEYSLSAPTPEAAAVAQLRLRELLGAGPALCKTDSTGAPRAAVAWVEGGSPLQPVAGRVLELMDLVDRGERDVVECLGRMVAKMKPRLAGANKARRRCHMDEQQVERALRQLRLDRPSAPNALLRDVLPVISQARLLEQPRAPSRSFAEALLDAESERAKYNLRPGFGNPGQSLQSAVPLLLEELSYEAGATLRSGKAQCPRTAYLSAHAERGGALEDPRFAGYAARQHFERLPGRVARRRARRQSRARRGHAAGGEAVKQRRCRGDSGERLLRVRPKKRRAGAAA